MPRLRVNSLALLDSFICILKSVRVKSGNFVHQVNSDIHLQTVEIQIGRLLMSRFIRIFTVCLVTLIVLFQNLKNGTNKVAVRIYPLSEVTWLYHITTKILMFYMASPATFKNISFMGVSVG